MKLIRIHYKFTILILTLFLASNESFAKNYYVASVKSMVIKNTRNHISFKTIQAAINQIQPGDTIFVYEGVYDGFKITTSGTKAPTAIAPQW